MTHDNWLVEEEINPSSGLDIRAVYIGLLQQIIDSLKEKYEYVPNPDLAEPIDRDVVSGHVFGVPTIIFAYLKEIETSDKALVQLFCYRDRQDFLKDMISYGDEESIKKYGWGSLIE